MDKSSDPLDPDGVHDRDSFFAFVWALVEDREAAVAAERITPSSPYSQDAGGWENITIESYLEGALRWAEDSDMGVRQGVPAGPSWQAFAHFLLSGKIYE